MRQSQRPKLRGRAKRRLMELMESPSGVDVGSGGCGRRDYRMRDGARIGLRQARAGFASCYCWFDEE